MINLKKPIGTIDTGGKPLEHARESAGMHYIAVLMADNTTPDHFSQIALTDSAGRVTGIVTTNGLARWVEVGHPIDPKASEFSECAKRFPESTSLEDIIETVADYGYVLITSENDEKDRILTYTDVLRELLRMYRQDATE